MSDSTKYIVITTINEPNEAILKFSQWANWQLVVVGDKKTPDDWVCDGVTYLSIEQQYAEFGEFAKSLPENTYIRKMLGYVYAIRHGATAIFESDDDNIPYADALQSVDELLNTSDRSKGDRLRSNTGWLNIYDTFGASNCWPRGFPLEYVKDSASGGIQGTDCKPWATVQFLADEDPDVDAVNRMIINNPVYFSRERRFIIDEGTYCPVNSQATLWLPEAFPLLFFPIGVSDRVTDILRGYIALACLWKMGYSIAYSSPIVYQERNVHNLFNDFQQEMPLYANADLWSRLLLEIDGSDAVECYFSAIQKLQSMNAISPKNMEIYKMFLQAAGMI